MNSGRPWRMPEFVGLLHQASSAMAVCPHDFLNSNDRFDFAEAMRQDRDRHHRHQYVACLTEEFNRGAKLLCQMYWCSTILKNATHPATLKSIELWREPLHRSAIEDQISLISLISHSSRSQSYPLI